MKTPKGRTRQKTALDNLRAFPVEKYADVDLNRLLVYAIGWLRDRNLPLIFEYITIASFRMFPAKFGLRGFDYPDSNRVNRGLLQLGPKYRNWARGSTGKGFALTDPGEIVLVEMRARLSGAQAVTQGREADERPPSLVSGYTLDPAAEIAELMATEAYERFKEKGAGDLQVEDVWTVVGAFVHTPKEVILRRLKVLRQIASDLGNESAASFLKALQERVR